MPVEITPEEVRHVGRVYAAPVARPRARPVHHVALGDPRHGVTLAGLALLSAGTPATSLPAVGSPAAARAAQRLLPPAGVAPRLHLHVTDGLVGDDPVRTLRALTAGRRLALSLHDLPQPGEGGGRFARRGRIYAELIGLAELVLVASEHERATVRRLAPDAAVELVPLAIDARRVAARPTAARTVGVLGWIYPGKGHDRVLRAMAQATPGATLRALGAPSVGHDELVPQLTALAAELGVGFEATGFLSDRELLDEAARVRVPVGAHRHVSASGSLGTWLGASRVPVTVDGPYARELQARCPGSLALTTPAGLGAALAAAMADPSTTVLGPAVDPGPTTRQVAALQQAALERWANRS